MKKITFLFVLVLSGCEITPTFTPDQDFETMINQARGKEQPLHLSSVLQAAADIHSNYMDSTGLYDHAWKDGTRVKDRLAALGYNGMGTENIAWGYKSESEVLQGWLDSPPHCEAILFPYYNAYGLSRRGFYWTLVLGYEYRGE